MVLTHVDLIEKLLHYNRALLLSFLSLSDEVVLTHPASHGEIEGSGPIRTVEAVFFFCMLSPRSTTVFPSVCGAPFAFRFW
jgi:hypothetical protein